MKRFMITFDEYDKIVNGFTDQNAEGKTEFKNEDSEWYPSDQEIEECIEKDEENAILFLIFLEATGTQNSQEAKEGMKRVSRYLYDHLEIVEEIPEEYLPSILRKRIRREKKKKGVK